MMADQYDAPMNGFKLIAAYPVTLPDVGGQRVIDHYIVVVDRETDSERYVTAWCRTLSDPEWDDGDYCATLALALRNARWRAGLCEAR